MMINRTKSKSLVPAILAGIAMSASAQLFIYEPFDYDATTEVNNGAWFGDGNQAGGSGLGSWEQLSNGSNVIAQNEGDVADEGIEFMDSSGNALPVAGLAYERRIRVGQVASNSPIDTSATTGLTADNSTMWMSFLFQDLGFSGPDFGIGLHTEKMIGNDNQSLAAPGFGVGVGINATVNPARAIATVVYDNSTEFTRITEAAESFSGQTASDVVLLAMKVNWHESGTPDEIFVFLIDDLTAEPAEADALAADTFDWDLPTQQSLDVINFSDTQVGYVDEIRVGTSFGDVVESGPPESFAIRAFDYSEAEQEVTLTWDSREGQSYAVRYSTDMINWDGDLDDSVMGAPGDTTTSTFEFGNSSPAVDGKLFLRIERN